MIILYSGSFSPITYGHYLVITTVMTKYPDCVMLIAPVNDHYRKELLPFKNRFDMINLTIKSIKNDHPLWEIYSSDFMGNGNQQYNDSEWIDAISKRYSDIYYLIGSDVDVKTWRQKDQDTLKKIHLLVFERTNQISSYLILKTYIKTGVVTNLIQSVSDYFKDHFSVEYVKKKLYI
jgi:nicotinic acid mononucleotide adenylyltransferase